MDYDPDVLLGIDNDVCTTNPRHKYVHQLMLMKAQVDGAYLQLRWAACRSFLLGHYRGMSPPVPSVFFILIK